MILPPDHPCFDDVYGALLEADPDAWPCARCGQDAIVDDSTDCAESHVCQSCRRLERRSQGETVRLFEPAPNQMPGQLAL